MNYVYLHYVYVNNILCINFQFELLDFVLSKSSPCLGVTKINRK